MQDQIFVNRAITMLSHRLSIPADDVPGAISPQGGGADRRPRGAEVGLPPDASAFGRAAMPDRVMQPAGRSSVAE